MGAVASFTESGAEAPKLEPWPAITGVIEGDPKQSGHFATSDRNTLLTGIWECTPGKFDVTAFFAKQTEFSSITAGRLRVIAKDGAVKEYGAGDSILTPRGFQGTWEVLEPLRKIFAIRKD